MTKKIEDKSKTIIAIVTAGDRIPFDGQVVDGCASVDEGAETGYSSPVLLEAIEGRDRALAGALVLDGWLKIESPIDARSHKPDGTREPENQGSNASTEGEKRSYLIYLALIAAMAIGGYFCLVF